MCHIQKFGWQTVCAALETCKSCLQEQKQFTEGELQRLALESQELDVERRFASEHRTALEEREKDFESRSSQLASKEVRFPTAPDLVLRSRCPRL